ncbi:MAG: hypothetical protein M3520_01750 [Actinomycetota bacterium]|nr:hypothetical protein [Actinomycetota bacterium]
MTSDPRAALSTLVAALQTHLELSAVRRGEDDPAVVAAYQKVADAFVAYDDALLDSFGEVTPLDIYSDEDDDDDLDDDLDDDDDDDLDDDLDDDDDDPDDDDNPDDDDTGSYVGLDDEEYDIEDNRDDARG